MRDRAKWIVIVSLGVLLLSGCNSYKVKALPYDAELKRVVVVENANVAPRDRPVFV